MKSKVCDLLAFDLPHYKSLFNYLFRQLLSIPIDTAQAMKRFMLSITEETEKALERERKKRVLGTIPGTARVVPGEYLAKNAD